MSAEPKLTAADEYRSLIAERGQPRSVEETAERVRLLDGLYVQLTREEIDAIEEEKRIAAGADLPPWKKQSD